MTGVKVVLKHTVIGNNLIFELPAQPYKQKIIEVLDSCNKKANGYVSVDINRPYKPRTTGEGSQNNLFYKLVTIIANEIGDDIENVKRDIKIKAVSKGYPMTVSKITGEINPYSTTRINTVEMSYLIDTCYEVISFLGIILEPELNKTECQNSDGLAEQALFKKEM